MILPFPEDSGGLLEILLCTPGYWAVTMHRLFHFLYMFKNSRSSPAPLPGDALAYGNRDSSRCPSRGRGCLSITGMGGGDRSGPPGWGSRVLIYQGVTLGATGNEKGLYPASSRGGTMWFSVPELGFWGISSLEGAPESVRGAVVLESGTP